MQTLEVHTPAAHRPRGRRPAAPLPVRWHTRADGERALFPDLADAEIDRLLTLAERDRALNPRQKKTVLHYRGRRFVVDCSLYGLRLWYGKTLLHRRFGLGL